MAISAIEKTISCSIKSIPHKSLEAASKPAAVQIAESRQIAGLVNSNASFIRPDKSLNFDFLRSLLKIKEGSTVETYTKIKDEMLKAMGFRHPELLKLELTKSKALSRYVFTTGEIRLGDPNIFPKERLIASLRHEMEHMVQSLKIYKAKGKECFAEAMLAQQRYNKRVPTETVEDVIKRMDINFFETMSKDVSIVDFDVKKYYKALCEYTNDNSTFESCYKYFNSLLEKDAYAVTRKVLKALGQDCTVAPDVFPANYTRLLSLLKSNGIHKDYNEEILETLEFFAKMKEALNPADFKRFIQLYQSAEKGIEPTKSDRIWAKKILKKMEQDSFIKEIGQRPYQQMETWLKEGKYTIEDLIKEY